MSVDPLRHLSVFSPDAFGERRVDIIGAGSSGSHIAMQCAKLGITNIHVWDADTVAEHNVANQLYDNVDILRPKVEALYDHILRATGTHITIHKEEVDGSQVLGDIVFLLTDSMISRRAIWERGIKMKLSIRLLIETRMSADQGRVYVINPCDPEHIDKYEQTLYSDAEAEVSACGASTSVGPTAEFLAGLATWQLIRWFAIENGFDDQLDNELIFTMRPFMQFTQKFNAI